MPWRERVGRQSATIVLEPRKRGTGSGEPWTPYPPTPAPLLHDTTKGKLKKKSELKKRDIWPQD